jgi:hypothetical protein
LSPPVFSITVFFLHYFIIFYGTIPNVKLFFNRDPLFSTLFLIFVRDWLVFSPENLLGYIRGIVSRKRRGAPPAMGRGLP